MQTRKCPDCLREFDNASGITMCPQCYVPLPSIPLPSPTQHVQTTRPAQIRPAVPVAKIPVASLLPVRPSAVPVANPLAETPLISEKPKRHRSSALYVVIPLLGIGVAGVAAAIAVIAMQSDEPKVVESPPPPTTTTTAPTPPAPKKPGTADGPNEIAPPKLRTAELATPTADLKIPDRSVRIAAIGKLAAMKSDAQPAIPDLLSAMKDLSPDEQTLLGEALEKIGPPKEADLPVLVAALQSNVPAAQRYALSVYADALVASRSAQPDLIRLSTTGTKPELRLLAVRAVKKCGAEARDEAYAAVVDCLADDDPKVADEAERLCTAYGKPKPAEYKLLRSKLTTGKVAVRTFAAAKLSDQAADATEATVLWQPLLRDENPQLRIAALKALAIWRTELVLIRGDLLEQTNHPNAKVRLLATELLSLYCHDSKVLTGLMNVAQNDADAAVREAGLSGLASLKLTTASDLPVLLVLLKSDSGAARKKAAESLAKLGSSAEPAMDELLAALARPPVEARIAIVQAIVAIKPDVGDKAVTPLRKIVAGEGEKPGASGTQTENLKLRVETSAALAKMGDPGLKALTALLKAKVPSPVLGSVCVGVAEFGSKAIPTLPDLYLAVRTDSNVREAVAEAFLKIAGDKVGGDAVIKLLCDTATSMNFKGIRPNQIDDVPVEVRHWGIEVLGRLDRANLTEMQKNIVLSRLEYIIKHERDMQNTDGARKAFLLINGK